MKAKTTRLADEMNKHTPGPWHFRAAIQEGQFVVRDRKSSGGFADIARVKGDKRSTLAQAEANARLIAAAPDLFELVKAMLANFHDQECSDEVIEIVAQAKFTIAKVLGESA